ncbi:hypothetical protein TUM12370_21420 [Salmonella enterica subsp. enterica serovar Choleraesuis]|nr:hypothetical protein TUM12370_21420 [Salmonella enterica subsp. enterica serovar Choleraesuis]
MEFHENRARRPFLGLVLIWRAVKKWYIRGQTRRILQRMDERRLNDIGLRREDIE